MFHGCSCFSDSRGGFNVGHGGSVEPPIFLENKLLRHIGYQSTMGSTDIDQDRSWNHRWMDEWIRLAGYHATKKSTTNWEKRKKDMDFFFIGFSHSK